MKRITDYVTVENVVEWWKSVQNLPSDTLADKMLAEVTPEMKELVFAIRGIGGGDVGEIGATVQYLDAAIQMRTKVQ